MSGGGGTSLPAPGRLWVKICGLTESEAVRAAVEAGADAVGFVLADSPRRLSAAAAARLIEETPPGTATVAVLPHARPDALRRALEELDPDLLQVEADGTGPGIVPARRMLHVYHDGIDLLERLPASARRHREAGPAILLEAPGRGGRGIRPDWGRAAEAARRVRLVLAGGLAPENVAEAIRRVCPAGVDVSSGVESRLGHKDPERIAAFVRAARAAEREVMA